AGMERAAPRERDEPLGEGAQLLRLHQRRPHPLPLEQLGREVAQDGQAVGRRAAELAARDSMLHAGPPVRVRRRGFSSTFIPSDRPISLSSSLISLSGLRPKFFVLSISDSLRCTSSPMVRMPAFLRQLYERTDSSSSSTERFRFSCSRSNSSSTSSSTI